MEITVPDNAKHVTVVELKRYKDKLYDRLAPTVRGLDEYKQALIARRARLPKHERERYEMPIVPTSGSVFEWPRGRWRDIHGN